MLLPTDFSYPVFGAILLLIGAAMGMFASPNRAAVMNSLPKGDRGAGGAMNQTFQNSAQVLSIGIFFTLMIIGLSATLPETMSAGLQAHGVDPATAHHVATLPPVSILFAAFLGYNPVQHLLGPHVLAGLSAHDQAALTGSSFFPNLISGPFQDGLHAAFAVRDRRVPDRRRRVAAARRAHGPRGRAGRARRRTDPPPSAHGRTRGAACRLSGTDSPRSASPTAPRPSSSTPSTTSGRWPSAACAGTTRRSTACRPTCCSSPTSTSTTTASAPSRGDPPTCARPPGAWSRRSARSSPSPPSTTPPPAPSAAQHAVRLHPRRAARGPPRRPRPGRPARGAGAGAGSVDLLFVPVGGGPTIGAEQAAAIAAPLSARVVVPMHYRTERIDFLEPVDAFAALAPARRAPRVERVRPRPPDALPSGRHGPVVVVPAAP